MHKLEFSDVFAPASQLGAQAVSDWRTIDQMQIDLFAEATGDRQWIHIDSARAKAESPYGATVAHGYLTLSLVAPFSQSCIKVNKAQLALNYGLNKVRFPAPVIVGSQLRCSFILRACEPIPGGSQLTWDATIEIAGGGKPACVAQLLTRWIAQ